MRLRLFDRLENVGVQLTIDVKQRLVVSTFFGEINDAEMLDHSSLIRSHPDFDPNFSELWDFSGVTGGLVSTFAIEELSRRVSVFNPTSLHVVVAPRDHVFGLARMAGVFAEKTKPNTVVVRSIEEARKILSLEKPALD
jgi:hypothetical protein